MKEAQKKADEAVAKAEADFKTAQDQANKEAEEAQASYNAQQELKEAMAEAWNVAVGKTAIAQKAYEDALANSNTTARRSSTEKTGYG